ncbi:MAG: hypothetical protein JW744_03945 [Candidatus Diapherotrites archaeon]|uniref:Uncharacterized protein n=1 Tax=Candidatus Iainarchaeum sp. TaxID=3101447 RepID=A0A939C919_9ARCH|nr:hypothetical protein [Candidatus Diapherotrites archaeon]
MEKKKIAIIAVLAIILLSGCNQPSKCGDGKCGPRENFENCPQDCPASDIPYYFLVIHAEPGGQGITNFEELEELVEYANNYNMKISFQFAPGWPEFISGNPERMALVNSWAEQGHEIGGHHHSIFHPGVWDGYSYHDSETAWQVMEEYHWAVYGMPLPAKIPEYKGNMNEGFMDIMKRINPKMNSGCVSGVADWRELPDDIIYDSCTQYYNFGEPSRVYEDVQDPINGKNEYVSTAEVNGIRRWWLLHASALTEENAIGGIEVFDSMQEGVYGVATHGNTRQIPPLKTVMDHIHEKDPNGEKSVTLVEAITSLGLPEKEVAPIVCGDGICLDKESEITCPEDCTTEEKEYQTEDVGFSLRSPNSYDLSVRILRPKLELYPNEKFPAVLKLAGGWGEMTGQLDSPLAEEAAKKGITFVAFDSPTRINYPVGSSERDYKGFKDQADVAEVLEFMFNSPGIDSERIGIWSSSSGALLASATLGRYPEFGSRVRFWLDQEGPHCAGELLEDIDEIPGAATGLVNWETARDAKVGPGKDYATEEEFWAERCGYRFLGSFEGIYQRIQGSDDHQLGQYYKHAVAYLNAATKGNAEWTRLNREAKNVAYQSGDELQGVEINNVLSFEHITNPLAQEIFYELIEETE